MTTKFFQQLTAIPVQGTWVLTIQHTASDFLVISVLLKNDDLKDDAKKMVAPLILRGTPEEFDNGFFTSIQKPIEQAAGLYVGLAKYEEQIQRARKEAKEAKDKNTVVNKEMSEKEKKYSEAMKKVDKLEEDGEFRKAWTALPEPTEYPENADAIRARRTELSDQFAPDLFSTTV